MSKKKQNSSKPAKKRRSARRPNPRGYRGDPPNNPLPMEMKHMIATLGGMLFGAMMKSVIRESLENSTESKPPCDCDCHVLGIYGGVPCPKDCSNHMGAKFGNYILESPERLTR